MILTLSQPTQAGCSNLQLDFSCQTVLLDLVHPETPPFWGLALGFTSFYAALALAQAQAVWLTLDRIGEIQKETRTLLVFDTGGAWPSDRAEIFGALLCPPKQM